MKKLSAAGRADLLRDLLNPAGPSEGIASLLGYVRDPKPADAAPPNKSKGNEESFDAGGNDPILPPPLPPMQFPVHRPPLPFLMATRAETLIPASPNVPDGDPIRDNELVVPWSEHGLPLRPLIPWGRLGRYLKDRLGVSVRGRRLDDRKLLRLATSGRPLTVLPRRMYCAWSAQAVILRDDTPEMAPFSLDIGDLCRRLIRERGKSGLEVVSLGNVPTVRQLRRISPGTSVVALSSMGQLTNNVLIQHAWQKLSRLLTVRHHRFSALCPCPRLRWTPRVADAWPSAVWDRRARLPRRGGFNASLGDVQSESASNSETLLTLLSSASRVDIALLRHVRTLLGRTMDAGSEWDAWNHVDCWRSIDCFGFWPGDALNQRLSHRKTLAESNPELVAAVDRAIAEQHKTCCGVIAAEAELRSILCGVMNSAKLQRIQKLLSRVTDRLLEQACEPGGSDGASSGLPKWFADMVDRLPPEVRQHQEVSLQIARGLALAHTWLGTPMVEVPAGVDSKVFADESRAAASRVKDGGKPVDYVLTYNGTELEFYSFRPARRGTFPLATFRVPGTRQFTGRTESDVSRQFGIVGTEDSRPLISLGSKIKRIQLESTWSRLTFEARTRPAWARRWWYDQFGLAADFMIGNATFVLRWIPPGRFLMGSPDSEPGRRVNEGPIHAVSVTKGFWMTESTITEGQWWAVAVAGTEGRSPFRSSSQTLINQTLVMRKTRNPDAAIEWVSWRQCRLFCSVFSWLINSVRTSNNDASDQLHFSIPTEAQWEFACRANSTSAFYDGSTCSAPTGIDLALCNLGWFQGNRLSHVTVVKQKTPNALGLYDMHGNVWEWCADVWNEHVYRSRQGITIDPEVVDGNNLDVRVVRGGSRTSDARNCRAAFRYHYPAKHGRERVGFRVIAVCERNA